MLNPTRSYAGIGSRETPSGILDLMRRTAFSLARQGWILRSGGARGADQAFESGAGTAKEIWLPWPGFEQSLSTNTVEAGGAAFELASRFHPQWTALPQKSKLLLARNGHQVLGADLQTPVRFVLCWTPEGGFEGGTGQALRIAHHFGIPIFNMFDPDVRSRLIARLEADEPAAGGPGAEDF